MSAAAKKVLVAEDFEVLSKLIRNSLRTLGVELVEAYDGEEALEKTKELRPDMLILDMDMPKMNGYEVAKAIRAIPHFSSLPILMLTATGSEATAKEAGCTAYMSKPYSPNVLRNKVAELLGLQA